MVTRLQIQSGDPDHILVLNSNQESEKISQRAEGTRDTMAQLPAPVLNEQFKENPLRDPKARNTRAKPPEPVPVPVEKHTMLL